MGSYSSEILWSRAGPWEEGVLLEIGRSTGRGGEGGSECEKGLREVILRVGCLGGSPEGRSLKTRWEEGDVRTPQGPTGTAQVACTPSMLYSSGVLTNTSPLVLHLAREV